MKQPEKEWLPVVSLGGIEVQAGISKANPRTPRLRFTVLAEGGTAKIFNIGSVQHLLALVDIAYEAVKMARAAEVMDELAEDEKQEAEDDFSRANVEATLAAMQEELQRRLAHDIEAKALWPEKAPPGSFSQHARHISANDKRKQG